VTQALDRPATKAAEERCSYLLRLQYFLLQALRDGESYELCLTTRLSGPAMCQPWACYQRLRRLNPAPYGAWLSFANGGPQVITRTDRPQAIHKGICAVRIQLALSAGCADLQVCCSSPERFLRGGRGRTLEARPIKVGDTQQTGNIDISATTDQRAPVWHHLAMAV
jgi:anthranilate/para-aminobenzoate synthase component I